MYNSIDDVPRTTMFAIILLAFAGSLLMQKSRRSLKISTRVFYFISDTIGSILISIITFYICSGIGFNELLSVGVAGFMAHQGARGIIMIELFLAKILGIEDNLYKNSSKNTDKDKKESNDK